MVEHTMDVSSWLRKQLEEASPDLLRAMVKEFAEALMSADADAVCGAGYGERSPERVNRRNGYRERDWDTRVGSIELAVPKLREGSVLPRLAAAAAPAGGAGVRVGDRRCLPGRRLDPPGREARAAARGRADDRRARSRGSRRALDQIVEDFRTRPLDGAPYAVRDARRAGGQVPRGRPHRQRLRRPRGRRQPRRLPRVARPRRRHRARTAPPGSPSCAAWSPAASPASSWSARTRTPGSSTRSPRRCRARPGSAAAPTSCATCSRASPRARRASSRRWCARSSPSPTPTPSTSSTRRIVDQLETRFPDAAALLDEAGARPARLHQLPEGALAAALEQQLARAAQQGDPPPHRRRRHLPRPRLDRPPRRRRPRRAERRVGRRPPLHERRIDRQGAHRPRRRARGGDRHRRQPRRPSGEDDALSLVHHLTGRGRANLLACSCRPLVNPDSSPRADRRKQAKWPETADQPGLEHIIRLLTSKHK